MRIRIEKMITGGLGLARRDDGMVVLTRFVLPGETVEVAESVQHRGYAEAELVRVLAPSPDRVEPPCPVYTTCGGCDFQHIEENTQLRLKGEMIREALLRAGLTAPPTALHPPMASPLPYGYRRRLRLKLTQAGELGLFRFRSNRIVPINGCPVATEALNLALRQLQESSLPREAAATVREIDLLHSPGDDCVHALLLPDRGNADNRVPLSAWPDQLPGIKMLWQKTKKGLRKLGGEPETLFQDLSEVVSGQSFRLSWPPGTFSQVNAEQNARLISLVRDLAQGGNHRSVLDLFCGMGNFSVPLALGGAHVLGVELNRESVAWAVRNAAAAGCVAARFIRSDVAEALTSPVITGTLFDLIVLDPPRLGLGKAWHRLADLDAGRIIYISCDPATLARDLALLGTRGYQLAQLTPVDMFPQTHHIEAVALLEKN
ncbi:MAG: class I SAM-dependent RNA methyltransferase [Desulfobulbaceae bacterium]